MKKIIRNSLFGKKFNKALEIDFFVFLKIKKYKKSYKIYNNNIYNEKVNFNITKNSVMIAF